MAVKRKRARVRLPSDKELKYWDTYRADINLPVDGHVIPTICGIDQGTATTQRIGRQIKIVSIHFKGYIYHFPSAALDCARLFRVILYVDKQCNGAPAEFTDIYTPPGGANSNIFAYRNLENQKRFRVLADQYHKIETRVTDDVLGFGRMLTHFEFNKDVDIDINYTGGGITVTSISSNNIGMIVIADGGSALQLDMTTRVRYVDS
jgi:hypothetical protein